MENKENELVLLSKEEYDVMAAGYKSIDSINTNIKYLLNNTVTNYLKIGYLLNCLTDELLNKLGCSNVYEYAFENFGIGTTTTKNFINIYKRFAKQIELDDISEATYKLWNVSIQDQYKDYSMTQLVELLTVSDEDITSYSPSLSVREIRALKKLGQLTDYEKSFVDYVKMSFFEIYNALMDKLIPFDILDEFKFNLSEEKVIFKDNKYSFNFNYGKHKNTFIIYIGKDFNSYWFRLESEQIKWNYKYLNTAALFKNSTDIVIESVVDEIFNYLSTTLIEFYEEHDNANEKKCVDTLQDYIDQFKEKNPVFKIERLFKNDIDNTLLKDNYYGICDDINYIRDIYTSYSEHPLFQNEFNYVIGKWDFDISCKINEHLTFFIENRQLFFEFAIDDYSESLSFDDLIKYPGVFKSYGLKCAATTSSFFNLLYDFACGWWYEKQNELYLIQKEQEENDNDPDNNDDDDSDEDVDYE